jgi:hypothetical protein
MEGGIDPNAMMLGTVMATPVDSGLNPDDKSLTHEIISAKKPVFPSHDNLNKPFTTFCKLSFQLP